MLVSLALALLGQTQPSPARPGPDSAMVMQAYRDAGARDIVARARDYRQRVDRSISRYQAISTERISLGLSALRRERLLFRRETAARIDWRRDGITEIEMLGGREVIPIALPGVRLPDDDDAVDGHAFDPAENRFFLGALGDSSFVYHPFGDDAEAHYRFRSGDTTVITLPQGRTVRLYELEVAPAIKDVHHFTGTVWVDADSYALVRAVFRLADAFDLERDGDDPDDDDVPGILEPIRAELKYFTIEYGLWELRWWMPRLVAFEAVGSAGGFVRAPLRYERTYSEYRVEGDSAAPMLSPDSVPSADTDSAVAACYARGHCRCRNGTCMNLNVIIPTDTAALLTSPYLPPSIYEDGEALITEGELRELAERLDDAIPEPPWQVGRPSLSWGPSGAGLLRYNRVEGLSVGARSELDFGRLAADATLRLGLADLEPEAELAVVREPAFTTYRLAAYRRLSAMNAETRPLGAGNSIAALLLGQDDGEYFRALGAELTVRPAPATGSNAWELRVYAEQQRPVEAETDFSVRHALDGDHVFRPVLPADRADQVGAAITLRLAHGLDPAGLRWGGELELGGGTGTFDYGRAALTARVTHPLTAALVGSIEAAAGTSAGTLPLQSRWFLGGPATVRGYDGAAAAGEAFWRGRAEVATSFPAARLALFGDAGWAGSRGARRLGPTLVAAGIGASLLDGIVRMDLARALEGPGRWRFHLYVDGLL